MNRKINQKDILTITQLNTQAKVLLEQGLGNIWIIGEISNLARPSSGHLYFSLKDASAQVRCALFRRACRNIPFTPENGQQVLAHARVSLYEPRGDYQVIIDQMQLSGDGALQIAFEKLKKELAQQGLFDEQHKQKIPRLPKTIGVITSATGAALRDIIKVMQRRFNSLDIIIYPCLVQGKQAAKQISEAIESANKRKECDTLIVARGGGSLEDLWPFNEIEVARAIFTSTLPIITGIGHEIDFTIADFVADARAPTPSAAAELASPNKQEWQQHVNELSTKLCENIQHLVELKSLQLKHLKKQLRHPGDKCREQMQQLDHLEKRLLQFIKHTLHDKQQKLIALSRTLDTVSPLKTLERGYAILTDDQQHVITQCTQISPGQSVNGRILDGNIKLTITEVNSQS
jgi:exodeoxyribonuclease VII large subunit